jgi:hypothetical protein
MLMCPGAPRKIASTEPVGCRPRRLPQPKGGRDMAKHRRPPTVGRHRYGTPGLVHCRTHEAVMLRIRETRLPLWSMLRWRGRHTAVALTRSGARPRPAFALIFSL